MNAVNFANSPLEVCQPEPDWLEQFQLDPLKFVRSMAQGIVSETARQLVAQAAPALPPPAATLDKVIAIYERTAQILPLSIANNVNSLKLIVLRGLGEADLSKVPLTELTQGLLARYQEACCADYAAKHTDPIAKREAVTQALRTTKGTIRQARCVFSGRGVDFIARYESEGLTMPPNVGGEFLKCKTRGNVQRKDYVVPEDPDKVFAGIFTAIETKRSYDVCCYLAFWMIAAFGLRQRELRCARYEHLVERDGVLWYHGGLGKNGKVISVPAQERAALVLRQFRQASGRIVDYRAGRRLNFFLRSHGLTMTRLASHELRAYIGNLLFSVQPRAAQGWLRHSSLVITEQAYAKRYLKPPTIPNVL